MIYTAITGGIDTLRQPITTDRHVAFFDGESKDWTCLPPTEMFVNPRRNARFHKVLMPNCDNVWVDGNIVPTKTIDEYLEMCGDNDIMLFKHPLRKCVYDEAVTVMAHNMDNKDIVAHQAGRYLKEGYPKNNGLHETGFLFRKNTPKVREFNRIWWEEICSGSYRDQISFDYCVWKTGIKVKTIEENIRDSKLVKMEGHGKWKSMFISTHNDDETLFGAYTIMREKPLVVIVTDSYKQELRGHAISKEERIEETKKAMKILGADVIFLHCPDHQLNEHVLDQFKNLPIQKVYSPHPEEYGNPDHNFVGNLCRQIWQNEDTELVEYSTYTSQRTCPDGVPIIPTEEEQKLKMKALDCYKSQLGMSNKYYFDEMRKKPECIISKTP
jgi:LmbE family N-acetylglucosaminyl deacetylase